MAEERGWRITRVLDTHVHADHLSRSRRLAELVGATLHMPEDARSPTRSRLSGTGRGLEVGSATLEAVWTPGHTPESTSYLLDGGRSSPGTRSSCRRWAAPTWTPRRKASREKARELYRSLQRLLALGPETLVLPGHTSEPVAFDGEPICAPLAGVRGSVRVLQQDEDAFVEEIAGASRRRRRTSSA